MKRLAVILFLIGAVLVFDEWVFQILPDLGWVDGGNPFTKHWMLGLALIVAAIWLLWKSKSNEVY